MPIQVLPPQLANQIAAGEVVERPASVVKELVENSLDAGATRIDIDIERAGAKLIRIRDNGGGIGQAELALALARHATSKISCLDDLEAITSMGFRGEALASVSSVSRLTLTSRTAAQDEAWQAYAEGRDMAVSLKPAAHPVGTTVEVLDLFYNTPARRKFLKSEKTEFAHIDEVVRRIALARFDVTFTLQHNGKPVRQYRAANQESQHLRRLGNLCGAAFVQRALAVSWQHGDLHIRGWVADPAQAGDLPEMQYCYVNQRMMRDKLINHAIRQAYQEMLPGGAAPAFVLFLTLDPHQVDVNVHPAKHEVRFHQARLVHDFIYQAVLSVLHTSAAPALTGADHTGAEVNAPANRSAAGKNHFARPDSRPPAPAGAVPVAEPLAGGKQRPEPSDVVPATQSGAGESPSQSGATTAGGRSSAGRAAEGGAGGVPYPGGGYQKKQGELYHRLLQSPPSAAPASTPQAIPLWQDSAAGTDSQSFGKVLSVYPPCYALLDSHGRLGLLSLPEAERGLKRRQLTPNGEPLRAQPLLIPLRLTLKPAEAAAWQQHHELLTEMGIALQLSQHQATLNGVPLPLRQQNLQILIPDLLGYLSDHEQATHNDVAAWLVTGLSSDHALWSHSQAIALLAEVERLCPEWVKSPPAGLVVFLDLAAAVKALNHE